MSWTRLARVTSVYKDISPPFFFVRFFELFQNKKPSNETVPGGTQNVMHTSFFHETPADRWVFSPGVTCTQPNNFILPATWRTVGAWYLMSLETARPEKNPTKWFLMLLLKLYFDSRRPNQHGLQREKSTGKYNGFGLHFILFCFSCTISVTQFTLCKQSPKFMCFPDSSDPPVRHCCGKPKTDIVGNSCR